MNEDEIARARTNDPLPSHIAAESLSPEDLRKSQAIVYAVLKRNGKMPDVILVSTYNQSKHLPGWVPQSPSGIRSRRHELVVRGLVEDTDEFWYRPTGRRNPHTVWRAI